MRNKIAHNPGRRSFLLKAAPACALACFGPENVFAITQSGAKPSAQEVTHKFDGEFGRKLTIRQYFDNQYREYIELTKAIEKEWGDKRTTAFLKNNTTEKLIDYGKLQASRAPDNSFESYVGQFRSGFADMLTMEIVEDTDTAFELKVTECIWADTFLRAEAGHIGYCSVCWGDYAWARAFNEKISMVRDRTLMQGHDCCNHRYLWSG